MPTVLVIGASRGIGLELVRQYADEGCLEARRCCALRGQRRYPRHRSVRRLY